MQTCSEARSVGIRSYAKIQQKGQSNYTYIDFSHDTLFFQYSRPNVSLGGAMSFFDTREIQSLAIDIRYRNTYSIRGEFTQLKELIIVAEPAVLSLQPTEKTSTILKDIEADYERQVKHGYHRTFEDVFDTVFRRFFCGYGSTVSGLSIFGPCSLVSLMVYERIPCDHVKLWDLGFALSSRGQGRDWSHMIVMEDPEL
jgi:hypothetical protein